MRAKLLLIAFLCLVASSFASPRPDSVRVSFVNFYPSGEIYQLEGHSALRLQLANGNDIAISYGVFDFQAPNFVYRFVKGETDYMVGAFPWDFTVAQYKAQGRRIVEHPVLLDSAQQARLLSLISENMRPDNVCYRYNYVKDNCATRPLLLLQRALGDSIILPQPDGPEAHDASFRQIMQRYHKNYPWYQLGIDLALGSGIDYPITPAEKAFAPVVLDKQLPGATVAGRRLTSDPIVLYPGDGDPVLGPTPWPLTPLCVFSAIALLAAWLTWRDLRRKRTTLWFDAVLYSAFGLAGALVAFLVFVSVHEATSPNVILLWLNPLCLIVPVCVWARATKPIAFFYQIVNIACLAALAIAWPLSGQAFNIAFLPLLLADALRAFSYVRLTLLSKRK